jgi:hypothetical protein
MVDLRGPDDYQLLNLAETVPVFITDRKWAIMVWKISGRVQLSGTGWERCHRSFR